MEILGEQKLQKPAPVVREIVRYLASRPGIGPGSRVLLCGVSDADLIQGLTDLGLLVTCMDGEDAESLQGIIPGTGWPTGLCPAWRDSRPVWWNQRFGQC